MRVSRNILLRCGLPLIACAVWCCFFPLWHIRNLDESIFKTGPPSNGSSKSQSSVVAPGSYVDTFWHSELRTGDGATDIERLWQAFDADANQAKKNLGRQVGLGGSSFFCVRGRGKVETMESNRCRIAMSSGTLASGTRQVWLLLDVIVDNTIRDAIGVNVSEFSNAQDFNTVSSELNSRVEQEIVNPSKALLKQGQEVEFVGCAKIGSASDLDPLCLVPIRVDLADPGASQ